MTLAALLAAIAGLITVGLGLFGLVRPHTAAAFVGILPNGLRGVSEVRATYGGLFFVLGLASLIIASPQAWLMVGLAWGGAALARVVSVVIDRSFDSKNYGGIVLEGLLCVLFLAHLVVR
ncbi:DUF4345 domain-containing protein [Deinococcus deserti]|uniref:DUF4345 domain-containing protein n=1 Tax=Deinococcus deserti (strain DSM 17065 / CIP 109153 / LMG 22923 / VCD115) TaxID=546414 RepID=C1D3F4_DEIDV|nr:DUF4345 family protein [Deinococcus deserti]ACO48033.1 Conserved hypothetical protein; putative membrane protein [Deinococcus deserti VCD115]